MMKVEITPKTLEDLEDLRDHLDEEFGKKKVQSQILCDS